MQSDPQPHTRKLVSSHKTRKSAKEKLGELNGESSLDWFEIHVDPDLPHRLHQVFRFTPIEGPS